MSNAIADNFLKMLNVRLDAFAMCEIADHCALDFPPGENIIIHYVLQGKGSIECEHGTFPVAPGMVAIIPKKLAKRINGSGPVVKVMDAYQTCPLTPGMVKVQACQSEGAGLVLGCALVSAVVCEGLGLFDHLQEPLTEGPQDGTLPRLFSTILHELSSPAVGTKSIVEALMKQILILILRSQLRRTGDASALYLPLMNPQLGRALLAMDASPNDRHCVSSLAKLAGMSRSRFTQRFTAAFGTSPINYLRALRLKRAATLLRSSTVPVKSIAATVGFASRSHFSKAFRGEFGLDPTTFRQCDATEARSGKHHRRDWAASLQRAEPYRAT